MDTGERRGGMSYEKPLPEWGEKKEEVLQDELVEKMRAKVDALIGRAKTLTTKPLKWRTGEVPEDADKGEPLLLTTKDDPRWEDWFIALPVSANMCWTPPHSHGWIKKASVKKYIPLNEIL